MRPLPSILLVLGLTGGVALLALRSSNRSQAPHVTQDSLPVSVIAKVGNVELHSADLLDAVQAQSQGRRVATGVKPEDLVLKEKAALERLIEDELLAQAAKAQGLSTALS